MSELSDEIKNKVIYAIRESARRAGPIKIKDLDKFMIRAMKELGESGDGVHVGQSNGGGTSPSITIIITGLKVPADIMFKISRKYFIRQRQYFGTEIVPPKSYEGDKRTATGQTLGRMKGQNLTDNMIVQDNFFSFHMPDAVRSGDVTERKKKAARNHWGEKYLGKVKKDGTYRINKKTGERISDPSKIQRGPRKGQPYVPKTYNEVAGYIEERKGKSIFFTDVQEIKKIIIAELVSAMR
jgi:hypothetical protein